MWLRALTTRATQGQPRRESLVFPFAICSVLAHPFAVGGMEEETFLVAFTFAFAFALSLASSFTVSALAPLAFPITFTLRLVTGLTFAFCV